MPGRAPGVRDAGARRAPGQRSSAWASSVAAAASHSAASRRWSQWPGSRAGHVTTAQRVDRPRCGARQILLGVDLAPARRRRAPARSGTPRVGDRVERRRTGTPGAASRAAPNGRVQPARERLAPDRAQRGRALGREAGEADELAGGLLGGHQALADARDARRRRRCSSTRASSASLTGCSVAAVVGVVPAAIDDQRDRRRARRPRGARARARTRCPSTRTGSRSRISRLGVEQRGQDVVARPSRGCRRSAAPAAPAARRCGRRGSRAR